MTVVAMKTLAPGSVQQCLRGYCSSEGILKDLFLILSNKENLVISALLLLVSIFKVF